MGFLLWGRETAAILAIFRLALSLAMAGGEPPDTRGSEEEEDALVHSTPSPNSALSMRRAPWTTRTICTALAWSR